MNGQGVENPRDGASGRVMTCNDNKGIIGGQVRSERSVLAHRCQPSLAPLSGTGKKGEEGMGGGRGRLPALAGIREYQQSNLGR